MTNTTDSKVPMTMRHVGVNVLIEDEFAQAEGEAAERTVQTGVFDADVRDSEG